MNQSGSVPVRNANGHQLHYQLRGSGPHAILCIPGALGTALINFLPQLEYFGRDGSSFTIVGMDPLGYGASRPPERDFVIKPESDCLRMDALDGFALMKALSFKKFSILGWCSGGVSATILAALYPESVQKLVICRGGEIGGAGGASAPPTLGTRVAEPPHFITCPYYKITAT